MCNMQDMHIDGLGIANLRLLIALYETSRLGAAAERVKLSQPAASHALARLRSELKDPLFARIPGGMRATPYGARLCVAAREALHILDSKIDTDRLFEPATSRRTFNMYMSDIGQMVFLPRLLGRLKQEAPDVTLHVRPVPLRSAHELLKTGEVDLAVGHFTNLGPGFVQKRLFREHYVCVARADHPSFRHGMTLEAFNTVPHALADSSGMAHHVLDSVLTRQRLSRRVRLLVPQFMVLPLVIASSDLMVIMPSRLADQFAQLVPLKLMPLPTKVSGYDIKLYWHANFREDASHRWLRELFADLFAHAESGVPLR